MIYYDEYGNKDNPAILMLHGAGALDTFCQQYRFSERYHLIVPHLPGAGKAVEEIYDPEKTKQALYELIAGLKKDRIGLIGHSLGGQLAVMLVLAQNPHCQTRIFAKAGHDFPMKNAAELNKHLEQIFSEHACNQ